MFWVILNLNVTDETLQLLASSILNGFQISETRGFVLYLKGND